MFIAKVLDKHLLEDETEILAKHDSMRPKRSDIVWHRQQLPQPKAREGSKLPKDLEAHGLQELTTENREDPASRPPFFPAVSISLVCFETTPVMKSLIINIFKRYYNLREF